MLAAGHGPVHAKEHQGGRRRGQAASRPHHGGLLKVCPDVDWGATKTVTKKIAFGNFFSFIENKFQ